MQARWQAPGETLGPATPGSMPANIASPDPDKPTDPTSLACKPFDVSQPHASALWDALDALDAPADSCGVGPEGRASASQSQGTTTFFSTLQLPQA